ncbi:hypothetical protein MKX73_03205 [Solibacillus sp. FSL W7-1436]|uniref:hypothetical protein n=1 Tax=Solibacillus sp. FSL W7-1436 TaxID=2921705 RepID=UPI0030F8E64C
MTEFKCIHCKKVTLFVPTEKNRLTCAECDSTFTKCKNKECSNLIKFGIFCSDCIGDGLKKGSGPALTIISAATAFFIKNGRK